MNYNLKTLRGDIFGGVTSTVVALPFALSFGVASGMGAAAGLYGAIAVGFFTALFGGTRTVISGPASSMTVAMAVIVTTHATNLNEALVIVVLGGLLQVLLGALGAGRFVVYTPYVVVSGFMSGIGVHHHDDRGPALSRFAPPAPGGFTWRMVLALPEALAKVQRRAPLASPPPRSPSLRVLASPASRRFLPAPLVGLAVGALLGVMWLNGAPTIGKDAGRSAGIASLGLPSAGLPGGGRTAGDRSRPAGLHRQPPGLLWWPTR